MTPGISSPPSLPSFPHHGRSFSNFQLATEHSANNWNSQVTLRSANICILQISGEWAALLIALQKGMTLKFRILSPSWELAKENGLSFCQGSYYAMAFLPKLVTKYLYCNCQCFPKSHFPFEAAIWRLSLMWKDFRFQERGWWKLSYHKYFTVQII